MRNRENGGSKIAFRVNIEESFLSDINQICKGIKILSKEII